MSDQNVVDPGVNTGAFPFSVNAVCWLETAGLVVDVGTRKAPRWCDGWLGPADVDPLAA